MFFFMLIFQLAQFFHKHTLPIAVQPGAFLILAEGLCNVTPVHLKPGKYAQTAQTLQCQGEQEKKCNRFSYKHFVYEPKMGSVTGKYI